MERQGLLHRFGRRKQQRFLPTTDQPVLEVVRRRGLNSQFLESPFCGSLDLLTFDECIGLLSPVEIGIGKHKLTSSDEAACR